MRGRRGARVTTAWCMCVCVCYTLWLILCLFEVRVGDVVCCAVACLFDFRILLASMCMSVRVKNFIACFTCVLTFTLRHYVERNAWHPGTCLRSCERQSVCVCHQRDGIPTLICVLCASDFRSRFFQFILLHLIWFLWHSPFQNSDRQHDNYQPVFEANAQQLVPKLVVAPAPASVRKRGRFATQSRRREYAIYSFWSRENVCSATSKLIT